MPGVIAQRSRRSRSLWSCTIPAGRCVDAVSVGLNAVIVAVTHEVPRFLTVPWYVRAPMDPEALPRPLVEPATTLDALPYGPLDPRRDVQLERALRRWVREQTGLELGFVEQLYTFGDSHRDPADLHGEPRSVSVAYVALVRESRTRGELGAAWRDVYECFPWEDWREGRPAIIEHELAPALRSWCASARTAEERRDRHQRVEIAFGLGRAGWDGDRVLERYELLYESWLVVERWRDAAQLAAVHGASVVEAPPAALASADRQFGCRSMALDHRRIVATALGRLRGKLRYRPVVFELLPPTFTLLQLQRVVEALAGVRLHKNNFRRLVERGGLVERTGQRYAHTGGRPAELFRFRHEVLRERTAPGVGLPGLPRAD
jgi:hypothetical protein